MIGDAIGWLILVVIIFAISIVYTECENYSLKNETCEIKLKKTATCRSLTAEKILECERLLKECQTI